MLDKNREQSIFRLKMDSRELREQELQQRS